MRVRLTRKLAQRLDGVDLRSFHVGDILNLPQTDARLLLAEGWAVPERRMADRFNRVERTSASTDISDQQRRAS
ncbi:MAG TPA: hypothetical protein VN654_22220 [Vicinamibacterales bacterium]|jgi:hypothetical protein|nr:hypothetical protein [Vicinamibacterales bacterium]